jgi:hypothetical protein
MDADAHRDTNAASDSPTLPTTNPLAPEGASRLSEFSGTADPGTRSGPNLVHEAKPWRRKIQMSK